MLRIFLNFVLIFILFNQCKGQETCTVEKNNSPGTCKLIKDCPDVLKDFTRQKKDYTICRWTKRSAIVCCPNSPEIESYSLGRSSNIRIHEQKCDEYKNAVFIEKISASLLPGATPKKDRRDLCGHRTVPLIVGGDLAQPREFPHMALIGYADGAEKKWDCGGTLISENYVLTAGHCLKSKQYGDPKFVRIGELDIGRTNEDAQPRDINIQRIIPHPEYSRKSKYNDIALLKLARPVELNPYRRPACLPTTFEGIEKKVIATGWGDTTWSGQKSAHLQKVILDKFGSKECNRTYTMNDDRKLPYGIQAETQLCAGSHDKAKDTCQGDSGGPIQVFHSSAYCMYTVVGITSFGYFCGNIDVPGVYTRVYPYIDWIERTVWGS